MSRKSVRLKPSLPRLRLREAEKDVSASNDQPQSEPLPRDKSKVPPSRQSASSQLLSPVPAEGSKEKAALRRQQTPFDVAAGGRGLSGAASAAHSGKEEASSDSGARGGLPAATLAKAPSTPPSASSRPGVVQGAAGKRNTLQRGRPDVQGQFSSPASPTSFAEITPAASPTTAATTPRTPSAGHSMPKVQMASAAAAPRAPTVVRAQPAGSTRNAATGLKATSSQSMASTIATQSCSPSPSSSRDRDTDLYHVQTELLELLDTEFSGTDVNVSDMVTGETRELYQCFLRGYARASCQRKRPPPVKNDLWELFEEVCAGEPLTDGEDDERDPSDGADHYAYFAKYAPATEPTECPEDNERRLHSMQMKFLGTRMALRSLRQEQAYEQSLRKKPSRKPDGYYDWAPVTPTEASSTPGIPARHRHSISASTVSFDLTPLQSEASSPPSPQEGERRRPTFKRAGTGAVLKVESDEEFGAATPDHRRGTAFFTRQTSSESDDSQKREHRASLVVTAPHADSNGKRFVASVSATVTYDEGNSRHSITVGGSTSLSDDLEMWAEPVVQSPPVSPRKSALSRSGDDPKRGKGVRVQIGFSLDDDESNRRTPEVQPLRGLLESEMTTAVSTSSVDETPKTPNSVSSVSTLTTPRSHRPALQRRARRASKLDERRKSRKNQAISSTSAAVTQAMKAEMRTREACESLRFLVFGCHAEEKRAKNSGGAFYDQACGNRDEVLQLHRIWTQMDEDGSGDIEFHEFLNFFSKSKADRLLGMRCVKYLVGTGFCDNEDNPQGCRIEDMMRLIWLKATKDDIATMMHWFHEAEHDKDRAPTPPLLPKRKRREILENFPVLEQGGKITFQDLVDSGLVDESTAKDLREAHDQENTNRISKDMLLLMLCPNGYRVKATDMTAVDKEGRKIQYVDNEYFTGWMIVGKHMEENGH